MQCCGKIFDHVSKVGYTAMNVVFVKKITPEKTNVVFCARTVSYVFISQLLNVYMLSCFRK
jgi:hypothetical protein